MAGNINGFLPVFIVGNTEETPKPPDSFEKLSRISMTHLTSNKLDVQELNDSTEGLGFFFDSEPSQAAVEERAIAAKGSSAIALHNTNTSASENYRKKKKKIIQDDSIYIDSEDDEDDAFSISSSEDISMLNALAHWGSDTMFHEESAGHRYHSDDEEDYAMLMATSMDDICDSDHDTINVLDSDEEQEPENSFDWGFSEIMNVPDNLKHRYQGLISEEKDRMKKQLKQLHKKRKTNKVIESMERDNNRSRKPGKKNIFDQ